MGECYLNGVANGALYVSCEEGDSEENLVQQRNGKHDSLLQVLGYVGL